ncbi:MerR family transcriptional regulator [Haloechinothrix sp. LS1_15]|uniref:transcriptional regulator FtsR n=1 Tax=Haloechinothrix sp. LS1_15 TaxID=2652248 RepID=UPI002944BE2B|nr:MerR family transcriptional regulator [Haloechinothrix sp. LS1_15]MDV6014622.1 MerR family transcriptional regulator [Haloechinothrix sp. LS1_15]
MTAAGGQARDGLSIGAVLAQLRPEFPDVTISKIRFLESEGLVRPARTAAGYRQFSGADVERLRFVLAAQRDHYLPLRVIREQLDAIDRGLEPSTPTPRLPRQLASLPGEGDGVPTADDFASPREVRLTKEELLSEAGIDEGMLAELERYGLITPGMAGFYDQDAVHIARTVRSLTGYGIEPRHLRAFRSSADREVGLLEQVVTPVSRHRDTEARARADEVVRELAALSVTLHTLLVKSGIKKVTGA